MGPGHSPGLCSGHSAWRGWPPLPLGSVSPGGPPRGVPVRASVYGGELRQQWAWPGDPGPPRATGPCTLQQHSAWGPCTGLAAFYLPGPRGGGRSAPQDPARALRAETGHRLLSVLVEKLPGAKAAAQGGSRLLAELSRGGAARARPPEASPTASPPVIQEGLWASRLLRKGGGAGPDVGLEGLLPQQDSGGRGRLRHSVPGRPRPAQKSAAAHQSVPAAHRRPDHDTDASGFRRPEAWVEVPAQALALVCRRPPSHRPHRKLWRRH